MFEAMIEEMVVRNLMSSSSIPNHWIVCEHVMPENDGESRVTMWLVPAEVDGWKHRSIYRGHVLGLRRVAKMFAAGIVPGLSDYDEDFMDETKLFDVGPETAGWIQSHRCF